MGRFANMSPIARRNALALMMLAVLFVGTGIAWVISAARTPARAGETWYLITEGGKPVGWHVVQRQDLDGDGSRGYEVRVLTTGTSRIQSSRWKLNGQATRGSYVFHDRLVRPNGMLAAEGTTRIEYDHPDLITIHVPMGSNVQVTAQRKIDVGYIPNGRLRPILAEVARTGEAFAGQMAVEADGTVEPVVIQPVGTTTRPMAGRASLAHPARRRVAAAVPGGRRRLHPDHRTRRRRRPRHADPNPRRPGRRPGAIPRCSPGENQRVA